MCQVWREAASASEKNEYLLILYFHWSNKISKNDIANKIDGIAGGDVYFVTKTIDLENIITNK